MDQRIFHIKELLSKDLSRLGSIEDMAAMVKMSVSHLQRSFTETTGMTPMTYLTEIRMAEAAGTARLARPICCKKWATQMSGRWPTAGRLGKKQSLR